MTACPCAQELVADASRERLVEQGFTDDEIERVFEAVPVATHNQRGIGTLYIGCPEGCDAEVRAETLLRDRRGLDELGDLRADEALRRARGGREGAPPAAVRRGLRARDDARPDRDAARARRRTRSCSRARRTSRRSTSTTSSPSATGCSEEIRAELDSGHHSRHHVTMREWLESPRGAAEAPRAAAPLHAAAHAEEVVGARDDGHDDGGVDEQRRRGQRRRRTRSPRRSPPPAGSS